MDQGVPDELRLIFDPDNVGGIAIRGIEEEEKHLVGVFGVDGKVHPVFTEGGAQGVIIASRNFLLGPMPEFIRHDNPSSKNSRSSVQGRRTGIA
jgi:hypothetical protein